MGILRTLSLFASAFILASCYVDMDPFEGGDGVRVNINGEKCVMHGMPGGYYAILDAANDVSSFESSITMRTSVTNYQGSYIINAAIGAENVHGDRSIFHLSFNIQENDTFVKEQKYEILPDGQKTATLSTWWEEVKLHGWIYFLSLGDVIEARFDLDGTDSDGTAYTLRHGFLRLHQKEEQQ